MNISVAADNSIRDSQGIFFKIKDKNNKTRAYLLGSIHEVQDKSLLELNPKIIKALKNASLVALELPVPKKLDDIQLRMQADGIDLKVIKLALENKKKFAAVDCEFNKNELEEKINNYFEKKKLPRIVNSHDEKLIEKAWKEGDVLTIQKCAQADGLIQDLEGYELAKAYNLGRNIIMVDNSIELIAKERLPFICIGVAHIPDVESDPRYDNNSQHPMEGMVSLLRKHFSVEQVFYHPKYVKEEIETVLVLKLKEVVSDALQLEKKLETIQEIVAPQDPFQDVEGPYFQILNAERKVVATVFSQSPEMRSNNRSLVRKTFESSITELSKPKQNICSIDDRIEEEIAKKKIQDLN